MSETQEKIAEPHHRRVRSFVLRDGRITVAQREALDRLWPIYGLDPAQPLDAEAAFGGTGLRTEGRGLREDASISATQSSVPSPQSSIPLVLEIGFGNGDSLVEHAATNPDKNYIGIEVHRPGVGHCLMGIQRRGVENLRIYRADALEVLEYCIPDQGLDGVQLYFPDPWPKSRHHKRRIVNERFVSLVARKLKAGGTFHAATDWQEYAQHMLEVLNACRELTNAASNGVFVDGGELRPGTKFEQRGRRLGHGVWDILYRKLPA